MPVVLIPFIPAAIEAGIGVVAAVTSAVLIHEITKDRPQEES